MFNDWLSVCQLLREIGQRALSEKYNLTAVLVDDGSTEVPDQVALDNATRNKLGLEILGLQRNVGHQRAIAIGLSYIADKECYDAVLVMDADGEDNPSDIDRLIDEMWAHESNPIVFAQRTRRTEGIVFRMGYLGFLMLHRMLTGRGCDVGNFSIIPSRWLHRVVQTPELWNHYAASVLASKLPVSKVPCPRAERYAGHSQMNLTSLIVHGLRAISVFGETVGVRVCLMLGSLIALVTLCLASIIYIRMFTTLAIPGWATSAAGISLVLLVNLLVLTAPALMLILAARSSNGFVPAHHWKDLVADRQIINSP